MGHDFLPPSMLYSQVSFHLTPRVSKQWNLKIVVKLGRNHSPYFSDSVDKLLSIVGIVKLSACAVSVEHSAFDMRLSQR